MKSADPSLIEISELPRLPKTAIRFVLFFMREQWGKFTLMCLASTFWALNNALFPFFLKKEVNLLNQGHLFHGKVIFFLIFIALFWLLAIGGVRLSDFVEMSAIPRLRASIRMKVFGFISQHSHGYFSDHFAGTIANKISDLPTNAQIMVESLYYEFLVGTVGAIAIMATLWQSNRLFFLVILLWLVFHFIIISFFIKRANPLLREHAAAVTSLSGKIVDVVTNIMSVKLFAREQQEYQELTLHQEEEVEKSILSQWQLVFMRVCFGINGLSMILGLQALLLYEWFHHQVTLGDFTQVSMQSFWLFGWMWYIGFQVVNYVRAQAAVDAALSLLQQEQKLVNAPDASSLHVKKGEIIWDKVSFSYLKGKPIFKDLSVTIPPGEKVGLVGFSGAGKSTFVNLLLRFYDLDQGTICIDRQSVASVTQESLRSQIAVIPQDLSLFHRSLRENIRYGRNNATDEEVAQAARLAHCEEFILELEQGYDTLVGERGVRLSGGQRQRIAIARAFLKNAPILLLDEATSSLDSVTERKIQKSLLELMKGRTTLVIAHRLATLQAMDRILVFDQGKIVEDGSIEELLTERENSGVTHFAHLWKLQYQKSELL